MPIYLLTCDEETKNPVRIDEQGNKEVLVNGFTDEWKKINKKRKTKPF